METLEIIKAIAYIISILASLIVIVIAYKRKDKAEKNNDKEEAQKMNDIINDQMNMAITNIKNLCNANNLMYNAKQTNKLAKKIIKENKGNDNIRKKGELNQWQIKEHQ